MYEYVCISCVYLTSLLCYDVQWGGNYFLIGGNVNGGKVIGDFPTPLSPDNDQWIGRGRFIPTTPWDSMVSGYFINAGIGTNVEDTFLTITSTP